MQEVFVLFWNFYQANESIYEYWNDIIMIHYLEFFEPHQHPAVKALSYK